VWGRAAPRALLAAVRRDRRPRGNLVVIGCAYRAENGANKG
jgi:hypothetical protein